MRCCAEHLRTVLVLLFTGAVAPAAAQSAQFEARVAEAIAGRWGLDPAVVHVELASADRDWPAAGTGFRVLGSGAGGSWIVMLEDAETSVQLVVRAGVRALQTVAARDLERGATLGAEDLAIENHIEWGPPRTGDAVVEVGWTANRRITRGEALRPPLVGPPLAVRPGDDVSVVVVRNGFTLTLGGRAAGGAAIGERVAVRAATGKRLEGIAVSNRVDRIDASRKEQP